MGVWGLMGHCLDNESECVKFVDIVEVAKEQGPIEILVDFYAFIHHVMQRFWKTMAAVDKNPMLMGGEYATLDDYLANLIFDLRSCRIHLVMYVDGDKGSSKTTMERKLQTWIDRRSQDMLKMTNNLDVIAGYKQITDLCDDSLIIPVLLDIQIFETFKKYNCEVVHCTAGEADYVLARDLMIRPKAFAILSNDSDFCIFKDCRFIPCQLFDTNNDMKLGEMQRMPEKPQRLRVGVIHSHQVASLLQLPNEAALVELSIIAGNDATKQFSQQLKTKLGLPERSRVAHVANWVREHKRVENHPAAVQMMQSNREFADSVRQSREFYSAESATIRDMCDATASPLTRAIHSAISEGDIPNCMIGIHRGLYWPRMMLEDCHCGCPNAETALAPLRALLYRIVLPRTNQFVEEYGRSPAQEFRWIKVYAEPNHSLHTFDRIQRENILPNLQTFARIMSFHEPDFPHKFMDLYDCSSGFKYLILRFFLRMNTGDNLYLRKYEFLALVAMVVGKVDKEWYRSLRLQPTVRCVTLASWFQDVYRHAYYFGKLLYLSHEFPAPKHIFSGAVWTAFYLVHTREGQQYCHEETQHIHKDIGRIRYFNEHIIPKLVHGIFDD